MRATDLVRDEKGTLMAIKSLKVENQHAYLKNVGNFLVAAGYYSP
ncbi:hypothetical protein EMIT0196MI5_20254 [Pseudomonas sp. IT-196MI5]